MKTDESPRAGDRPDRPDRPERSERSDRPDRFGQRKDPRLEGLISDWKKGEKDKWRGHGKKDGKKKR